MSKQVKIRFGALAFFLFFLFCAPASLAQCTFTTVTGQVIDPHGLDYSNGTISATLLPSGIQPLCNGVAIGGFTQASLDINGRFSMNLASNPAISPGGTQWQFTVNGTANLPPPVGLGGQSFTTTGLTISGGTMDISATLNALATPLTVLLTGTSGVFGSGTPNFFTIWTGPNTIGNGPCSIVSAIIQCVDSLSVTTNALMVQKTNSASGTTQFLAITLDNSGNAITASTTATTGIFGIAGPGAGTSGPVQIAIGGDYSWTCDNATTVRDWLIVSTTVNGECHDAGATEPTGVQNVGRVAIANAGAGTNTVADLFTPDVNGNSAKGTAIFVNGVAIPGTQANFNNTTPVAQAGFVNLTWQSDTNTPATRISAEVSLATSSTPGLVELTKDFCGTYNAPLVCGLQGNVLTVTSLQTNQVICATSTATFANCYSGVPPRFVSIASDTILATDREGWVVYTNAGAVAVSLPAPPGSGGAAAFGSNFPFAVVANGGGTVTITPAGGATITKNAVSATPAATLQISAGTWCLITTDNTNWYANCTSLSSSSLSFAAITNGTNTTAIMNVGAGASLQPTSTGVVTSNKINPFSPVIANDCAGFEASGSTAIPLQDQGACGGSVGGSPFGVHDISTTTSYTLQVGDDKHLLTGEPTSAATYILPGPGTGSPYFVSDGQSTNCSTANTCSVTLALTAGNAVRLIMLCRCEGGTPPPVFSVTDNASDTYVTTLAPTHAASGGLNFYVAEAIAFNVTGGSTTITDNCSNCSGFTFAQQYVYAIQYSTLTAQDGSFASATTSSVPNVSITTNFRSDVVMEGSIAFGCNNENPSGFSNRFVANSATWPGGAGATGTLSDAVVLLPGVQNLNLTTACTNTALMWAGAFRATTTAAYVNGFSFLVSNRGTAPITLSPSLSSITTQWYTGAVSGAGVTLQPGQNASCMSDGFNWQCVIINHGLNSNVSPVTANANVSTDQNLIAFPIPANTLNHAGNSFRVFAAGLYTTPAASTATIQIKAKLCTVSGCGSGTVLTPFSATSSANPGSVTNNSWNVEFNFTTQATGVTSAFESHGNMAIDLGATPGLADSIFSDSNTATVGTIDSTAATFLQITVAFSSASASNSATQRQLLVQQTN